MPEDNRAHFPSGDEPTFGRNISTAVAVNGGTLWAALQLEDSGRDTVAVFRFADGRKELTVIEGEGFCHQPGVTSFPDGQAVVVWNEALDKGDWAIRCALLDGTSGDVLKTETVHVGPAWCLPPAVSTDDGDILLAWPKHDSQAIRIHLARRSGSGWQHIGAVSEPDVDAFRPSLATTNGRVFLAWDSYKQGTYSVSICDVALPDSVTRLHPPPCQRWLHPKLLAAQGETLYATWTAIEDVMDDRGIVDHAVFAPVAELVTAPTLHLALDAEEDAQCHVADLRDGLLATDDHPYRGYAGLRRNPQLTMTAQGELWCLWEARFGHEDTSSAGHLLGRRFTAGGSWTQPRILHSGGYAYSVPKYWPDNGLPIAFLHFDAEGMDIVCSAIVDEAAAVPHHESTEKWQRWYAVDIQPPPKKRTSHSDGSDLRVFWADTHCHSEVSSDAEGQVDELIHFARDAAGLDAVCIIDNDYYPHKSLSEAEWRAAQKYAERYTQEGKFVVFPGWEYTYHRKDLEPSFNHRVIMYPRPGWPLFRRTDRCARSERDLMQQLRNTPAVCYAHHCSYEIIDAEIDRNIEVCSSWRVCLEESDFTIGQLQAGHKLGFIGSSDSHRAVPGLGGALTGIIASELTPEALFDAYRARRTIATQGHRVEIDFRVGDTITGGESTVNTAPNIVVSVRAPEPIEFIELIRDGLPIYRVEPNRQEGSIQYEDDCATGEHFYFVRVKLVGNPSFNALPEENFVGPFKRAGDYPHNLARARGPFAWTSPIWVTRL